MGTRETSHAQRLTIIHRHLEGATLAAIATEMALNFYTVRKWWRAYRRRGWPGLVGHKVAPKVAGPLGRFDGLVRFVVLRLKREHPGWGPDKLRLELQRRPSLQGRRLPGRSTIAAYVSPYLMRLQPDRETVSRPPQTAVEAAETPHERWQMDFKGQETFANIGVVKPFQICDDFTCAPLVCTLHLLHDGQTRFPLTTRHVQANLRQAFTDWGLPDAIKMDRDPLWVGSARLQWPGLILLWLVGLGVTPIINRPYRPTDNPRIERTNRTWWNDVGRGTRYDSLAAMQQASDQARRDRLFHLSSRNPACDGLPPALACPALLRPRRSFNPHAEAELFSMPLVHAYLATWSWQRKVDKQGCISMANHNRRVSQEHVGQVVNITFNLQQLHFEAYDAAAQFLNAFHLPVIDARYIIGIDGGTR